DLADELARGHLVDEPGRTFRDLLFLALGAERQHTALELDVDPVSADTRNPRPDDDVVGRLIDVEGQVVRPRRRPREPVARADPAILAHLIHGIARGHEITEWAEPIANHRATSPPWCSTSRGR